MNVVNASFIYELDKNGLIDAVWKKYPAMNMRDVIPRRKKFSHPHFLTKLL
ncbi:MAG TPA: hypothetical protein VJ646_10620 [Candidatus Binatia bacterium]|nr:hypothetical protein [Candidatus Binatia bacterium]